MAAARFTIRDYHAATTTELDCKQWMRAQGLLARNMQCQRCGGPTEEKVYTRVADGVTWRCPAQQCRATTGIRKGSFFEKSHLSLQKALDLLYYWSVEMPAQDTQFHVGVDEKTVTDWYNFARDICSEELINNPLRIGGAGHTVAIDESVVAKTKPGNARARPVPPQWVFGGVDLGTGEFFMELVPQRDAATLQPIIQRTIAPGTRIWSDQWAAYNGLNALGYVHQTVNHTQHFVDPVTGVHTNNIEARWSACKASFKRRFGVARHMLPAYLNEYVWRARTPRHDCFHALVAAICRQYPV